MLSCFLLVGCASTPDRAAKEWFEAQANSDGNTMLGLTCESEKQAMQELGLISAGLSLLPQLFGFDIEGEGDLSDVTFTTTREDSNLAYVHVSGTMRVAVLTFAQEMQIDETWIMAREDDTWKWCGLKN